MKEDRENRKLRNRIASDAPSSGAVSGGAAIPSVQPQATSPAAPAEMADKVTAMVQVQL
jgi:hypothetical protein